MLGVNYLTLPGVVHTMGIVYTVAVTSELSRRQMVASGRQGV
jgi:hypothetical protein